MPEGPDPEVFKPALSFLNSPIDALGVGPRRELDDPESGGGDLNDLEKDLETSDAEPVCDLGGIFGIEGEVPNGTPG